MKSHVIIPILNSEYKVIVAWGDIKRLRQLMKRWGHEMLIDELTFNSNRGITFYSCSCHPFIALPHFPKTASEIGTLAHEATHAVLFIFNKINEQSYNEIFAHSVGAIVRETLNYKNR